VTGYAAFDRGFPGQWGRVSLPASQQQVLDRIESDLEGGEPRLRSMFAIFTRLTRDDGAPHTESLRPGGHRFPWASPDGRLAGRVRAIIAIALILSLMTFFMFMAVTGSGTRGCLPGAVHGVARAASCQSTAQPPAHS
jgi:hypothetical protein